MPTYQILFKPAAERDLRKLPRSVQRQLAARIDDLARDPRPSGCKKLEGMENLYRIRSGDYRILYTIHEKTITVLVVGIAHRRDAYRKLRS